MPARLGWILHHGSHVIDARTLKRHCRLTTLPEKGR
jgi:hypothetical protein